MLATILKSPQAVQATLAIIETFSKMRKLTRNIKTLSNVKDKREQKALMQKSGEIIAELLDDDLETTNTETSIELNFAVLKFKHTIKNELLRRNVGGTKVMQLSRNVPHYHYSDLTDLLDNNRKLALDTILHCRWKYKTTSPIRR
jgi:hypothetical protein